MVAPARRRPIEVAVATGPEREAIYGIRHAVYAEELGQHRVNAEGRLRDPLDAVNTYLVARVGGDLAGFVSITPPGVGAYSIDKYVARSDLPFAFDQGLYELRLLTVVQAHRGGEVAALLMYAAFRWVEAHGGTHVVVIGRREVAGMYIRGGLEPVGRSFRSGAVTFDCLHGTTEVIRERLQRFGGLAERIEGRTDWRLSFPFRRPAHCFHGGAFFDAVGPRFDDLERGQRIINADVLDAWFPPSPAVLAGLQEHLPWLLRTAPPTACEGLVDTIAAVRGVPPACVLPGAGSSDLIFRALLHWLTPAARALIVDPTYGEYAHVLEQVIGCAVDRFVLSRDNDYDVDPDCFADAAARDYDLIVIVNPNSPTGRHVARPGMAAILRAVPESTRVWVDETYVEYAGADQSLESLAARSENVVVCKSMSKVYALSGARVAYLCAGAHQLESLRALTPPWVIGLPSQVAAVRALRDPAYYAARYAETHALRAELDAGLRDHGWATVPGVANFILAHLPEDGPDAATVARGCREHGLYVRDAGAMGVRLGRHALRLAVKDHATIQRMLDILAGPGIGGDRAQVGVP